MLPRLIFCWLVANSKKVLSITFKTSLILPTNRSHRKIEVIPKIALDFSQKPSVAIKRFDAKKAEKCKSKAKHYRQMFYREKCQDLKAKNH